MRSGKKIIVALLALLVVLFIGVYYGAGYVVFNQLTAVESGCQRAWMEGMRDNTPAEFVARLASDDNVTPMPHLAMQDYQDVTIRSREDNVELSGWFIPAPEPGDYVVLVVHGIHSCKRDSTVLIPAGMLHRNGFNVLMLELRNHGDSEITNGRTTAGNHEYVDVLGAFDWLQEQGYEADHIALMGISFGGGTSAIAFGEEPEIPVLWLDSPFGNINEVVEYELERNGYPTFLIAPAFQIAQLNGIDFYERSPDRALQNHQNRPIMIVHGDADVRVPFRFGEQLYQNAGDNAEFLPFEGLDHVEAMYIEPEIYEAALIRFLNENLVNDDG